MRRWKDIAVLFVQFMKFGCFTFGGGWSIVAQMQQLYVEQRHTITNEELLDLTSVGRSLPGTMIGNVAMLYGCHAAGLAGGVACVLGVVLPPMAGLAPMTGVRASIVPIMAAAALNLVKGAFRFPPCAAVAALAFVLYLFFDVSCVWLVLMGVVSGIALCEFYEQRGGNGHGAA